jgi:nitrate/nitrite-specific signal transduction histidine kinase
LTNTARHTAARSCYVHLFVDEVRDMLVLEITDDGVGIPEDRQAGVRMSSMRERAAERAAELGGTLTIEPVQEGCTRVLAPPPAARQGEVANYQTNSFSRGFAINISDCLGRGSDDAVEPQTAP